MDLLDETELQSPEAESALLGAVAFAPDALAGVLAALPAQDFYNPARAAVWEALRARSAERQSLTPAAVARDLARDGRDSEAVRHVVQVTMSNAQPAHYAPEHARTVADLARRRELVRAIKRAYVTVRDFPGDHSEILARVRSVFDDLGGDEQRLGGTKTWTELLDEFDAEHAPGAEPTSILTPWAALDSLIGGLFPGRMYVIGGSAGAGKSTVAINVAAQAAAAGHAALIFSKEMPTIDVTGRLVAYGAEVNLARINARRLHDDDRAKADAFAKRTAAWRMRVNADPVSLTGVKHLARALRHRGQLDLLVVDYLQLMTGDKPGRTAQEEIAQISTGLKGLAMELGVPVVVPAQLNRAPAARPNARPTKSDLRESGRIEQDADVVILLWRKPTENLDTGDLEPDPHNITLIVDKNRHGPEGEILLRWDGGYGRVG
jgi:replicative DNA helicase